eukprot:3138086-Prymnesium_polylepis.1
MAAASKSSPAAAGAPAAAAACAVLGLPSALCDGAASPTTVRLSRLSRIDSSLPLTRTAKRPFASL